MTFTIYTVAFALALSACSGAPTERVAAESSPIVDAGPPCKNGGHEVSTLFASYGYYDTADGLISCQNFAYATAQTANSTVAGPPWVFQHFGQLLTQV